MRRLFVFLFASLAFVALSSTVQAQELIRQFDVRAELAPDRSAVIEERITYDFGESSRHGIYRLIPEVYDRNGGSYNLHLTVTDVQMDKGFVPYEVQRQGRDLQVKIGDPGRMLTGVHTYLIQYRTNRSLNDFSDHVEWYWNVTGNGWLVPIERVGLELIAPSSTQRDCFVGLFGSREASCVWKDAPTSLQVSSTRILSDAEGMTVVFGFPRAAFTEVSLKEKIYWYLQDNIWIALPILAFVLMWMIWYRYGKEPKGRGTVIPHYEEPRHLPPGLQAALLEQSFSPRAVTATILDIARRGYLKIEWESASDIAFIKQKKADSALHEFEKILLAGMFDSTDLIVRPAELRATFSATIETARAAVFKELQSYGWFERSPALVRAIWIAIAIVVGALLIISSDQQAVQIVSSVMCGLIIIAFGWQMPRMSKEGAIVAEEIQGFRWFLSVTEEKRLEFTDAPVKKPEQFARFLPVAVAFAIEKQWAHQFDDMMIPQPSYIEGNWSGWTALQMANTIDTMHHTTASSMYSPPSSGGSGSSGFSGGGSGGGMGGGGGGSW